MLGPVIGALALVGGWRTGVDDALSSAQGLSTLLSGAAATVNGPLVAAEAQLVATANALATAAASTLEAVEAAAFRDSVASALATTTALGASVSDANSFLARELNLAGNWSGRVPRVNVGEVRNGLSTGVWVLLGVGVGWLLIMMTTLTPSRASAVCFRLTSPLALALGVALPVLAGALYGVALLGADFCAAPSTSISALLNYTNAPTFAADTIVFYATCVAGAGAPGSTPLAGATAAIAALANARDAVAALNASVASDPSPGAPALLPILGDATYSIGLANASALALQGAVECAPVQRLWLGILTPMCNTALVGAARTTFLVLASAAAMTVLLCFGASLCQFHAGDAAGSAPGPRDDGLEGVRFGYQGRRASEAVEWGATAHVAKYSTTPYERSYGTA